MNRCLRLLVRIALLWTFLASALTACEPTQPEPPPPASAPERETRRPDLWTHIKGATVVAVNDPDLQRDLAKASASAQATLNDARQRWAVSKPGERTLWAVKWAAPLAPPPSSDPAHDAGGNVEKRGTDEHVWVRPLNWSAFRIEGVLLSDPTSTLECRRTRGEIVSFPIEEVSDWVHFASEAPESAFEGGYTMKVLEEKYGGVK
jgi:hypothetical protein